MNVKKIPTTQDIREMDTQLMRDTQYRKELSIAFFNATNSAITLVSTSMGKTISMDKKLQAVTDIREHFLNEYKQYRVDILDTAGKTTVDPKVVPALDKLKTKYESTSKSSPANAGVVQP